MKKFWNKFEKLAFVFAAIVLSIAINACSNDSIEGLKINKVSSTTYYENSDGYYSVVINLDWPEGVPNDYLEYLQEEILNKLYGDAIPGTHTSDEVIEFIGIKYGGEDNIIYSLPEYNEDKNIYYHSYSVVANIVNERLVRFDLYREESMAGGSIHSAEYYTDYVNYDSADGEILNSYDIFTDFEKVNRIMQGYIADEVIEANGDIKFSRNTQFALMKDSIMFHFGNDMSYLFSLDVTVPIEALKKTFCRDYLDRMGMKIELGEEQSFDYNTFNLFGKVSEVNTTIYSETDESGNPSEYSETYNTILKFYPDGIAKLRGEKKRDAEGRLISHNEYPLAEYSITKNWSYDEDGKVSKCYNSDIHSTDVAEYIYNDNKQLISIKYTHYNAGGFSNETEYFNILEVDKYENWTSRIIKRVEGDRITFSKETRNIVYF